MTISAYSDLKPAWHIEKIAAMRRGEQVVPAQVQLILSDLCNQDCHFCAYRMSGGFSSEQFAEGGNRNPNRKIPTEKALEILEDCRALGVKAVQFTGGGEPTVHPDHLMLFECAQELGLETSLVTNGVLLRPGWERVLPRMKWIRVSIDSSTPAEYAAIRRVAPGFYDKALANVAALAREIDEQGTDCLLGVGYVITPENWDNLYGGIRQLKDTGAAYVRLSAMFSTEGEQPYLGIDQAIRTKIEAAKRAFRSDSFGIVDLYSDRIADLHQGAPDYEFCGYQQMNCYIGGNLKVYRCCTTAYTAHGEVGDLSKQSFASWFYGQAKTDAYANFSARSCATCQFNGKNKTILYMVGETPQHVNFV